MERIKKSFKINKLKKTRSKNAQGSQRNRRKLNEDFTIPDVLEIQHVEEKIAVNKLLYFGRSVGGFHSSWDKTSTTELKILRIEKTIHVETVIDMSTGASVRADLSEFKIPKFQLTFDSMTKLVELGIYSYLPFNRLSKIFGNNEFPLYPSKIERAYLCMAELGTHPYLALIDQLSDVKYLKGDDIPTSVLKTEALDPNEKRIDLDPLVKIVEDKIGHTHARVDGKGNKKAINVSLLLGRTNLEDPCSTIIFYRTHRGHLGDLLGMVLENRLPKSGHLNFQGDLSKNNSAKFSKFIKYFNTILSGCCSHARRPFFRERESDEQLCYFFLRAFALLAHIEHKISEKEGDPKTTYYFRNKFSRKIWEIILKSSKMVIDGIPIFEGRKWPPKTKIYLACKYITNNYLELTQYLNDHNLTLDNNLSERLVRPEKLMLLNCKFRNSERGRVVFDILRTLAQTCRAAEVPFGKYMKWLKKNENKIEKNADLYTPYAFKKFLFSEQENHSAVA